MKFRKRKFDVVDMCTVKVMLDFIEPDLLVINRKSKKNFVEITANGETSPMKYAKYKKLKKVLANKVNIEEKRGV